MNMSILFHFIANVKLKENVAFFINAATREIFKRVYTSHVYGRFSLSFEHTRKPTLAPLCEDIPIHTSQQTCP